MKSLHKKKQKYPVILRILGLAPHVGSENTHEQIPGSKIKTPQYCWWFVRSPVNSPVEEQVVSPILYKVLVPSQVVLFAGFLNHQRCIIGYHPWWSSPRYRWLPWAEGSESSWLENEAMDVFEPFFTRKIIGKLVGKPLGWRAPFTSTHTVYSGYLLGISAF